MLATARQRVLPRSVARVILPRESEHDLDEQPRETRDAVAFVFVDSIEDVFDAAFGSNGTHANGRVRPAASRR
jgi:ATP-dependent Lon protease